MKFTFGHTRIFLILIALSAVGVSQQPTSKAMPLDFEKAAQKNSILMYSLKWTWGKEQKGWHIYTALLKKTLGTEAGADSKQFAENLAGWQTRKGIIPDGVLGQKTLFSFIEYWQSKRIRPIYEAGEDALEGAPISNFYDPTREEYLLKLDSEAFLAYQKMFKSAIESGAAADEGKFLKIISAYRSPAYQMKLRKREPNANRAQIAYRSPHFTGRALDIYVGGEPVTTKDPNREFQVKTEAYLWLVENAESFGFHPYFYEPWHWEYVGEE